MGEDVLVLPYAMKKKVFFLFMRYFDELSNYFNGKTIGETIKAFEVTPNLFSESEKTKTTNQFFQFPLHSRHYYTNNTR